MTLFAFDKGEEISSHESKGDAMVQVLDGKAKITIGDGVYFLSAGETVVMPAGIPHALEAVEFWMQKQMPEGWRNWPQLISWLEA